MAVIQTYAPKNEIIRLACTQDYEKFYEGEIAIRKELSYPPFCDIATLTVTSSDEPSAIKEAKRLSDMLIDKLEKQGGGQPFMVFGPFEAGVYRVNEKYRMRLVIKCKLNKISRGIFSGVLCEFNSTAKDATLSVEFNPMTA